MRRVLNLHRVASLFRNHISALWRFGLVSVLQLFMEYVIVFTMANCHFQCEVGDLVRQGAKVPVQLL